MISPHRAYAVYQNFMPPLSQMAGSALKTSVAGGANGPSQTVQASPSGQAQTIGPATPLLLTQTFTSPSGYPLTLFTLPNGHRLMVEERPSDFIGVRTFVNSGSAVENGIKPSPLYPQSGLPSGIAHLDEHAHFLATQHFPQKNAITAALSQMGAQWNASTGEEQIQHELFFNREDLDKALRLHAESVLRPLYNASDIQQEKDAVINENLMRMGEVPYKMIDRFYELMFDRPFRQGLGALQDVQRTAPPDLQRFHNLAYAPTNLFTVVTGNVNPQQILTILAPDFLNNPSRNGFPNNAQLRLALKPGEKRVATVVDPRITNSRVHLGFPAPPVNNFRERMAMEFLAEILGGSRLSVLNQALVDRSGLATRVQVEAITLKQAGFCKFNVDTPVGKEREAASALLGQLALFQEGLVSQEQLAQTRQALIQRFRESFEQSRNASQRFGEEALNNTLPYLLNYEQIASLITPEDLRKVAQTYLNPNTYALVYGLPGTAPPSPPDLAVQAANFSSGFQGGTL
jgi:zinc protease